MLFEKKVVFYTTSNEHANAMIWWLWANGYKVTKTYLDRRFGTFVIEYRTTNLGQKFIEANAPRLVTA